VGNYTLNLNNLRILSNGSWYKLASGRLSTVPYITLGPCEIFPSSTLSVVTSYGSVSPNVIPSVVISQPSTPLTLGFPITVSQPLTPPTPVSQPLTPPVANREKKTFNDLFTPPPTPPSVVILKNIQTIPDKKKRINPVSLLFDQLEIPESMRTKHYIDIYLNHIKVKNYCRIEMFGTWRDNILFVSRQHVVEDYKKWCSELNFEPGMECSSLICRITNSDKMGSDIVTFR
jgi:hypothetical protein